MAPRKDGSSVVRLSGAQLARAKDALSALLTSRRLNFLVDGGVLRLDRRMSGLAGVEGLVHLLAQHVASFPKPGDEQTTRVSDRQLVDAAFLSLIAVLEEAARRLTVDDAEE